VAPVEFSEQKVPELDSRVKAAVALQAIAVLLQLKIYYLEVAALQVKGVGIRYSPGEAL